jgi:hypothetical protein
LEPERLAAEAADVIPKRSGGGVMDTLCHLSLFSGKQEPSREARQSHNVTMPAVSESDATSS